MQTWTRIEWNHDGSAYYFARQAVETGARGLFEHDLEARRERAVYTPGDFNTLRSLKWSASRQWLAFLEWSGDAATQAVTAVVLKPATGEYRRLTTIRSPGDTGIQPRALAWAPGDAALALLVGFAGRREEQVRLVPLNPRSAGVGSRSSKG